MNNPVKVVFMSTIANPNRKWYTSKKLLYGAEIAQKVEDTINEQLHKGYRFLRSEAIYSRDQLVSYSGDTSYSDLSAPNGLLLYFERIS